MGTEHVGDGEGVRGRVAAYATLVRAPNLFTAPPDILLGAALASVGAATGGSVPLERVAALSLASMLLYGAGTTLNDYADASVDATERPERPIPSGAVSPRAALAFGGGLLCAGVAVAAVAAGATAGLVAGTLATAVVLYDFPLKGTVAGFGAMGATRGLNVLLGTAAVGVAGTPAVGLAVPVLVAGYVATVTWMAADETGDGDRRRVLATWVTTWVVAAAVPVLGWLLDAPPARTGVAAALAAGFLALTGRPLRSAYRSPAPGTVGPAVGTCVLGLVVLDAAFVALVAVPWAAVTVGFLPVAAVLSRRFDVS